MISSLDYEVSVKMKPSKEKDRYWIGTRGQLTEAEEKQKKFNPDDVITFLKKKGYENPSFGLDPNRRMILVDNKTSVALELNETLIDEIAQKTGLLSGKWLIFVQKKRVDGIWEKIWELANEEKVWGAKVSTSVHPWASRGKHVICVYTMNYLDEEDIMRVRETLRDIGIESRLYYKPDIYTLLGIYSDNKESFNLRRTTRYMS